MPQTEVIFKKANKYFNKLNDISHDDIINFFR